MLSIDLRSDIVEVELGIVSLVVFCFISSVTSAEDRGLK